MISDRFRVHICAIKIRKKVSLMSKVKKRRIRREILKTVFTLVLLVVALFPAYWMISLSIRSTEELSSSLSVIPKAFTFDHFKRLFVEKGFMTALLNSVTTTVVSMIFSLIFGICCAYILARDRFVFKTKKLITYWVLLVRILPPVAFAIPLYMMFAKMNVLSSLMPVISACIFINIPLTVWFIISFFKDLPIEIEESAKIDGASEWQLFMRVVMPLVLPGIAAVAMLSFIYAWNEYTYSIIFIQSPSKYTVPLALAILNTEDNMTQFGLVAAGGVISIIPIFSFVVFAQKYLISGLSSGAVKG